MGKRAKFPQFAGMTLSEIAKLIELAKLSQIDTEIARGKLLYDKCYADIGADVNIDRSAVGYRMKTIIAPKLTRWMPYL